MESRKDKSQDTKSAIGTAPKLISYTRTQLLEFGRNKASKELPKVFNFSGADEKRKEKLRNVLKNCTIPQAFYQKNGAAIGSHDGVTVQNEQSRSKFQKMISDAVNRTQQQNTEYAAAAATAPRRRIGSGRIVQASADTDSDEPEWANCGPISKHDIIELHGFDGPEADETQKSDDMQRLLLPRSTPSKNGNGAKKTGKMDEHFNFEDFLKLDLPATTNSPRDHGASESRSSQWFGYDKAKNPPKFASSAYESKSTSHQFFDQHQKASQKKMNAPNKFRSVDELEASWHPGHAKAKKSSDSNQAAADNAIRLMLAQLAQLQRPTAPPTPAAATATATATATSAQSNFFLNLMNKGANSYQYRMSQSALMERPDAQLMLHRLVNGEITQFHILQQIGNPTLHQRDRETLLGVFKFCNEQQQWLLQQQEQQLKHKQQMSQQFRFLQLIQMKNATMQSPLQAQAQAFIQNSIYKKQFEDMQLLKTNQSPKYGRVYKGNPQSMPNQQSTRSNSRGYH